MEPERAEKLGVDPIWLHVSNKYSIPLIDGIIGEELCECIPMFIGRATINGERFLANVAPSKDKAIVNCPGEIHTVKCFDLLVGEGYKWELLYKLNPNRLPPFAVSYGCTYDGQSLYIGRTKHNGIMRIGSVDTAKGGLVFVDDKETIIVTKMFQLLTKPYYGDFLQLLQD